MYTIPCEAIFNQHPRVFRSALVGVGARGEQTPVIVVEPNEDNFLARDPTAKRFLMNSPT